VVARFAQEIRQRGAANFLYSDGLTLFAHAHRRTLPGSELSDEPGLYVNLYESSSAMDMAAPCQGLKTEGRCSKQAFVASAPLNDHEWLPLTAGQIACFQHGQRIK
jgi:glutamine amidotransferase